MAAWIKGEPVGGDEAVAAAADLLGRARAPLLAGLQADADGIAAAYRLAAALGASVDPLDSPRLYGELTALAGFGAVTTSPGEAIGRADVILAVGRAAAAPGLARARARAVRLGSAAGLERRVIVLGGAPSADADLVLPAGPGGAVVALATLRALAGGRLARGGSSADPLAEAADLLRGARFGVALYDAEELGDLGTAMLNGLAAELNEGTRFFTLPVGGGAARAALPVAAWSTGGGPRVGFGRGAAEHDPWRFDAARQVRAGEADAALWLAALPAPRPAWAGQVPLVALLGDPAGDEADIVLAVAVPGAQADGILWDEGRGTLVFRAGAAPDAGRPTAALALAAIIEALPAPEEAAC